MLRNSKSRWSLRLWMYGLSIVMIAVSIGFAHLFNAPTAHTYFLLLYGAVGLVAWYSDFGVTLLAIGLAAAASLTLGIPSQASTDGLLDVLTFSLVALVLGVLIGRLKRTLRAAYDQVASHAAKLERQVVERTQDLQKALEQAQEADRAKMQMLANVSHEMRTPLSSIVGFSNLLLSRHPDSTVQRQYLLAINEEGRRLTALVDDLLDLRRIETNHQVFRFSQVDMATLITDTLRKQNGPDHAQRIRFLLNPTPSVQADPDRIRQVLLNLVSNALKFSDSEIEIALDVEADAVHVSVRDRGVGIPPHELGQIFTLFYRGETAERKRIRGTGLGLALCKEIIEAHHGHIWAESTGEAQGASFHFTLPLVAEDNTPAR